MAQDIKGLLYTRHKDEQQKIDQIQQEQEAISKVLSELNALQRQNIQVSDELEQQKLSNETLTTDLAAITKELAAVKDKYSGIEREGLASYNQSFKSHNDELEKTWLNDMAAVKNDLKTIMDQ